MLPGERHTGKRSVRSPVGTGYDISDPRMPRSKSPPPPACCMPTSQPRAAGCRRLSTRLEKARRVRVRVTLAEPPGLDLPRRAALDAQACQLHGGPLSGASPCMPCCCCSFRSGLLQPMPAVVSGATARSSCNRTCLDSCLRNGPARSLLETRRSTQALAPMNSLGSRSAEDASSFMNLGGATAPPRARGRSQRRQPVACSQRCTVLADDSLCWATASQGTCFCS